MSKLTIKVHENKSEDFNYGRVSTPVAQAYKVLDDQYCDEKTGKMTGPAFDSIMLMAENDEPIYNYAQSKRVKSHSVAWMALLKDIAMTLQWHDDVPHAENLTSEQVKNWFKFKGQDYKTELAPLVKLIDEWRADMFKDESKKSESLAADMSKAIQQSKPKVLLSDDAVDYFNDYDSMLDQFEGAYQTVIHINGKHGVEEMLFIYEPDDNIVAIGDFDVDRADAERAKELMEKFVRGELTEKPGNSDDLESVDYIAIVDGNTYTSTAFVEG
jgi:hypothetical protein